MGRISYNNEKELALANPRDLLNFFSMLTSENKFNNKTIFVGAYSNVDDSNPLMCTATIRFQVFGNEVLRRSGTRGVIYEWRSFRAKSFTCSNSSFVLVEDTTK